MVRQRNTIVWPENLLVPRAGRAMLQGFALKLGVIVSRLTDGSTANVLEFSGYVIDLTDQWEERTKFIPTTIFPPSSPTYADFSQRELISFSDAIFDEALRIIMRKTTDNRVDLLSFLKPFSRNLWWLQ